MQKGAGITNPIKQHNGRLLTRIWANRSSYILLLPAIVATVIFCYGPMYGILLGFKDYNLRLGITHSPWASHHGFGHFVRMFQNKEFLNALQNSVIISATRTVVMLITVVIIALMLNELKNALFKRTVQTVIYLPYFLSWVVMSSVVFTLLSVNDSPYAKIMTDVFNMQPTPIFTNPRYFRPMIYLTSIWKDVGFNTIIYLAAIAGINQELYEAAKMDGAGRIRQIWHITLPGIRSTIILLTLLSIGGLLSAGFDQIFNMLMPQTYSVGDIIDTFVYRKAFKAFGNFSFTTAVDFFKQIVGIVLLVISNFVVTRFGEESII